MKVGFAERSQRPPLELPRHVGVAHVALTS